MDKLHYLIFLLIAVSLFISGLAVATVQGAYDQKRDVKLELSVNGLLNDTTVIKANIISLQAALIQTTNRSANNTDRVIELENYDQTITSEIAKVNREISTRYPQPTIPDDSGQSGTGTTSPTLTIHLDSDTFFKGDIIWISGQTTPKTDVEATVKDPLAKKRYPHSNSDQNGGYKIAYVTNLNTELGEYSVFVTSQGKKSQTLTFTLK